MDNMKRIKIILAICIFGPIILLFILALSPLILLSWGFHTLNTIGMTPEQKKRYNAQFKWEGPHAYSVV